MKTKITVIIPTIGRTTLERSLQSIKDAKYDNIEVIIVTSVENREKVERIAKLFLDLLPIVIYVEKEKLYPGEAKNIGLENASGDYVTFLDDDDFAYPEKFHLLAGFLDTNIDTLGVYGKYDVCDTSHVIINRNCGGNNKYEADFDSLVINNYIASGSIMLRNISSLKFPDVQEGWGEDYALWMELLGKGYKIAHIENPVYIWTMGNGFTHYLPNWRQLTKENQKKAKAKWRPNNESR